VFQNRRPELCLSFQQITPMHASGLAFAGIPLAALWAL
jgi:hypothetical protein